MLLADLDTIQLESGIGDPILENTRSLDYIEWGWIPIILRIMILHTSGLILVFSFLLNEIFCYLARSI
jgi:hypothetical protein